MTAPLAQCGKSAYLHRAMILKRKNSMWRDVSPTGAVADFIAVWRSAGNKRWRYLLASGVATMMLFWLIVREEHRAPARLPGITYINSWRADRSDAEIKASNQLFQSIREDKAREQAQAEEETKAMYRALGRISGMDVDKIEREAAAERAAEAKAKAAEVQKQAALQAAATR
jgi:hypothetical protein